MQPLGNALRRVIDEVPPSLAKRDVPIIEKITFGGELKVSEPAAREGYKGRLFWARVGNLIYSKIRVKQGSVTVVSADSGDVAVSSEYPVYEVKADIVDPGYLELVLGCSAFQRMLDGLSHGGSTKTRIHPNQFEALEIPLPPLATQQAIVRRWREARATAEAAEREAETMEREAAREFLHGLGLKAPDDAKRGKMLAVKWQELERWGLEWNQQHASGVDLGQGAFPVSELGTVLERVQYGTSEKANTEGKGIPVIRINNIKNGVLDLSDQKHIQLAGDSLRGLALQDGDILIIRTSGSRDLVGTCAVFHSEGEFVFASYLIRLRTVAELAHPDYVVYFLNSPLGRAQVDATSRQIMQNNINSNEIRSLTIPLPPLETQQTLVTAIETARQRASTLRAEAQRLRSQTAAEAEVAILGHAEVVARASLSCHHGPTQEPPP